MVSRTTAGNRLAVRNFGSALSFVNGGSNVVTTPNTLTSVNAITYAGWIKRTGSLGSGIGRIFADGTGNNLELEVGSVAGSGSVPEGVLSASSGGHQSMGFKTKVGVWYFVVLTKNNTTVKLYVDGAFIQSGTITSNTSSVTFRVGNTQTNNEGFAGLIADAMCWTAELTAAEVTALYYNDIMPSACQSQGSAKVQRRLRHKCCRQFRQC
jgi:hypothetical protein